MAIPSVVATSLLQDKEFRDDVRAGVKTTSSVALKVLKGVGISIGGVILFFVGKKVYKNIKERMEANKAMKNQTKGLDDKKITKAPEWFDLRIDELKKAMELTVPCYGESTRNYNANTILSIINACGNQHDWLYLCQKFGVQTGKLKSITGSESDTEPRTLIQWLGYDDSGDIAKYNSALQAKDVPASGMITQLNGLGKIKLGKRVKKMMKKAKKLANPKNAFKALNPKNAMKIVK